MLEKRENKYITSEIGWKSGISSRQRECTGSLKMCHGMLATRK
jgi:hypothetical protein